MTHWPLLTPVTTPFSSTVAMVSSLEVQASFRVSARRAGRTRYSICRVSPWATVALDRLRYWGPRSM